MEAISIPIEFVLARTRLTWGDAQYGLDHGWLNSRSMIDLALTALEHKTENDPLELRLAGLREDEEWAIPELVEKLAQLEPADSIDEAKKKWLCLILAWLYERRAEFDDPFPIINEIYADFDYPEEIKGFVSYMPLGEPRSIPPYKAETPRERMLRLWQEYVGNCHGERGRTEKR